MPHWHGHLRTSWGNKSAAERPCSSAVGRGPARPRSCGYWLTSFRTMIASWSLRTPPSFTYRSRTLCRPNATLARPLADFLGEQIRRGKTLLISGGTGTGKTTLLRILADFIPDHDRIVVIEDTSELHIQKPNIVPTECHTGTATCGLLGGTNPPRKDPAHQRWDGDRQDHALADIG